MWNSILAFNYPDYFLEEERRQTLYNHIHEWEINFLHRLQEFPQNLLSTSKGVHVQGTEEQGQSDLWHEVRRFCITGSKFGDFCSENYRPEKIWDEEPDLNSLPAIRWGRENEENERNDYEEEGTSVEKCGIFFSRNFPYIGASPDGLIDAGQGVLEIKAPFSLRECHPSDFGKLPKNQKSAFFCEILRDGKLRLKRNHKYFKQVQCQMFVTGCKYCDFVV
jgi:hypothetical protein